MQLMTFKTIEEAIERANSSNCARLQIRTPELLQFDRYVTVT